MIHTTAVVHPDAKVDPTVEVGPYAVIDENVELGPHCLVGPYVYLTGVTSIGACNRFHAGCVVGDAPQDLKYRGEPTRLRIGEHNVFREHATVHRSTGVEGETVIGSHNLLMAGCHVGHDSVLGDHVILANGALLGGHVMVGDRAVISGNCLIHQFVRVGTLAMMQGGSAISMDLPPYIVACGGNAICGLNTIGLRRAGIDAEGRLQLKRAYRMLFRSGQNLRQALAKARQEFKGAAVKTLLEFIATSKRGICSDVGTAAGRRDESEGTGE